MTVNKCQLSIKFSSLLPIVNNINDLITNQNNADDYHCSLGFSSFYFNVLILIVFCVEIMPVRIHISNTLIGRQKCSASKSSWLKILKQNSLMFPEFVVIFGRSTDIVMIYFVLLNRFKSIN